MREFHFNIIHKVIGDEGNTAATETRCQHVLPNGKKLDFKQTFIFELEDGLFKRVSAYEPYGPHGVLGLFLGINHYFMHLMRKV